MRRATRLQPALQCGLAALRLAYLRRQLTVVLAANAYGTRQTLGAFTRWGLIGHFESAGPNKSHGSQRLYLRYMSGRAAVSFDAMRWRGVGCRDVGAPDLRKWAQHGGGATLILATPRGWLTHAECIRLNIGGRVVLSLLG